MNRKARVLGKELVRLGIISNEQLNEILREIDGKSLMKVIAEKGYASEKMVAESLAKALGYEYIDLSNVQIDPTLLALVPEDFIRKYNIMPFELEGNKLRVAISDPSNVLAIDDLKIITGYEIEPFVSTESEIVNAIDTLTRLDADVKEFTEIGLDEESVEEAKVIEEVESEDAPIVKLVNAILTEGVRARASDIIIEPHESEVRVRYRIDGVYHEIMKTAKSTQLGMITRIKILSNLNIAEKRVPQDGRINMLIDGQQVDFRVATFPTIYGEAAVLRILEKGSIMIELESLGFLPEQLEMFKEAIKRPWGAIIVTGPTGSGKTTTLYSSLNMINDVGRNIITVEDPVEYRLEGINQVQINPQAGLTFATALRSILRNDPDVVMIGEIRDAETATIAIEAALTGHLVLSTLHTNNAAGVFTRLIEMGLEPFLISSAIDCVVAQRLARKLCEYCKEPYKPDNDFLKSVGFSDEDIAKIDALYKPRGCDYCSKTGYKGRTGLYEVLKNSDQIRELVLEKATTDEITEKAKEEGMRTMLECGLQKVIKGITSIEEVLRVVS